MILYNVYLGPRGRARLRALEGHAPALCYWRKEKRKKEPMLSLSLFRSPLPRES